MDSYRREIRLILVFLALILVKMGKTKLNIKLIKSSLTGVRIPSNSLGETLQTKGWHHSLGWHIGAGRSAVIEESEYRPPGWMATRQKES